MRNRHVGANSPAWLMAPDGPAGGGAPGGAPAGGNPGGGSPSPQPGGQPGGAPAGGAPGAATAYRPDGLPDHFSGTNDKETIDKLFGAVKGFRTSEGERGAVPKAAADYKFEPSDKLKPYVANFDKDPMFGKSRDLALKAGITDKQFAAFIPAVLEAFVDGGLVDAPVDAQAQLMKLAPPEAAKLPDAEKSAAAGKRVKDNLAWIDGAKAQKTFGPNTDQVAEFFSAALASDPRAHHAVEWLRGNAREVRPALDGGRPSGQSEADIRARVNDPKNDPRSPQFDRAFAAETDRLSQAQWG